MSNDLPQFDLSGIEALRKIKEDQDVIKGRLEKMISMKESVSDAVYSKVYEEYSAKLDEATDRAEPLKNQLRAQYSIMRGHLDKIEASIKQLNMQKEELEFRNTLGEFTDEEFAAHIQSWEEGNAYKQADLEECENMKALLLTVFDSEEDLDAAPELTTMPVNTAMLAGPALSEPSVEEPVGEIEIEIEDELEGELEDELDDEMDETPDFETIENFAPEPEVFPDAVSPDAETVSEGIQLMPELPEDLESGIDDESLETDLDDDLSDDFSEELEDDLDDALDDDLVEEFDDTDELEPPPLPDLDLDDETAKGDEVAMPPLPNEAKEATMMMETLPVSGSAHEDPETMIIATPKVVSMNNATEGQVTVLGMGTTSIGRSPDSDIHITEDRISRKHSQITFGPGGYALYDLNSENGTFVNGQRIREYILQDGDIIQVGTYKYLYRDH